MSFYRVLFVGFVLIVCLASRCTSDTRTIENQVGTQALELTQELVALGPRPPGSAGITQARNWIEAKVKSMGLLLTRDLFTAQTPLGSIEMENLSYSIPGTQSNRRVLLLAHYDSKRFVGFDFVGANDAASSVALLLSLSSEVKSRKYPFLTEIIFLDGEEALVQWTSQDGLYGSRHLASQLTNQKQNILGAVVVDMVGDRDLKLIQESYSDVALLLILKEVLQAKGLSQLLDSKTSFVQDDHVPLAKQGIPVLHLMDFTFGGDSSPGVYWHTPEDTMDKISATSLSIVGDIILAVLDKFPSN